MGLVHGYKNSTLFGEKTHTDGACCTGAVFSKL